MPEPDANELHALGDFWDAVPGEALTTSRSSRLDPALADAVLWVMRHDDAPAPEGAFVARLQHELLGASTTDDRTLTLPASRIVSPNGWKPSADQARVYRSPAFPRMSRFAAHLATAVLLAVTILVSAFGLGRAPVANVDLPTLGIPPFRFIDPATSSGVLTGVTVPELPVVAGYVGIERLTYPPHSDPVTTEPMTGPLLMLVTSGTLTVALDGEGALLRSQTSQPSLSTLATTTGEITAGTTLLVPARTWLTTSNHEAAAATALLVAINEDTMSDWVVPFNQTAIEHETLGRARGEFVPGEAGIALRRETLDPGASVPGPAAGAFQLVGAESKFLGYLARSPDGTVTNREPIPLEVLIVTITQPPAP